ncbi:MAG TPA: hypothetical protein VKX17_03120 [Planctomycetota bacterium]|nr:hypothetical protein [Planctomycetota bacterium]
MDEPLQRKWLQVHLSTAVVLMFVAGALIWANIGPRPRKSSYTFHFANPYRESELIHVGKVYGWPYDAIYRNEIDYHKFDVEPELTPANVPYTQTDPPMFLLDLAIAPVILFATWFACERWIAWRSLRKKTPV